MKIVRGILIGMTLICMLAIWPFCIILRDTENRSGDESHAFLEPLEVGESVAQSFRPEERRVHAVDFVLSYQPDQALEGELLFELLDDNGTVLHQETLQYKWISSYQYFSIYIDQIMSTRKVYQYRLTNINITENQPVFVYTTDPEMYSGLGLGMEHNGVAAEGELLTRYHWKTGLAFWNVVAIWGLLCMACSAAWELTKYISTRKEAPARSDAG